MNHVYTEFRHFGASRVLAAYAVLRYIVLGDSGRYKGIPFRARHFYFWSIQKP